MKTTINCTKEDIMNLISAIEYLEYNLSKIDVSDDFASDEDECINAYELISNTTAYQSLKESIQ